jgi:hypothetical protein
MKEFDTLLIVGDSFCMDRKQSTDWPVALGKLTGCTVKGKGFGGGSWWSVKKYLDDLDHDKSKTVLIICHTESSRLPNDYDLPITIALAAAVSEGSIGRSKSLTQRSLDCLKFANAFYESDLFSLDFYNWAQLAWINEINSDSEYYAIINILSMGQSNTLRGVENKGIVVYPFGLLEDQPYNDFHCLALISHYEIDSVSVFLDSKLDTRANHFSEANNINLANALLPIVQTLKRHDKGIRKFDNISDWDLNPNGIGLSNVLRNLNRATK